MESQPQWPGSLCLLQCPSSLRIPAWKGGAGLPSPRDPCSLSENECSIAVMKCKTRARKMVEKSMLKREECWGAVEMASGVGMGTV